MTKQPSYRFTGYTEPWEEKKLGEYAKYRRGSFPQPYGKKEWYGGEDSMPFVQVIDVTDNLTLVNDTKQKISKQAQPKSVLAPEGTVIVTLQGSIGRVAITHYDTYVDRTLLIFESYNFPTHVGFWAYTIQNKFEIERQKAPGGTIKTITKEALSIFEISLPFLPEQTAIGSFFQDIDQFISLQQRKLEVLKEQKKTYLKLLFPAKGQTKPALRFTGFEDDWKEVKLGEVLKKNNKKNRDLAINNVESVSNKLGFVKQTEQFEDYSVASADLSNYYVISEKQFAYNPSRINVGSIAYKKEGDTLSVVSPLYISFSTVENTDDSYLWYWFKTSLFDSQRAIYSEGGVRDTLSFNQLSDIELIFPTLPEQEAIGSFFQDLDKAIAKQEEKVNQLKESKQTLLRKMFI